MKTATFILLATVLFFVPGLSWTKALGETVARHIRLRRPGVRRVLPAPTPAPDFDPKALDAYGRGPHRVRDEALHALRAEPPRAVVRALHAAGYSRHDGWPEYVAVFPATRGKQPSTSPKPRTSTPATRSGPQSALRAAGSACTTRAHPSGGTKRAPPCNTAGTGPTSAATSTASRSPGHKKRRPSRPSY